MFRIGEFSKLAAITVKMLRHYDEIALLKPAFIEEASGYRYYAAEQLAHAGQINLYKSLGFSLKEITVILQEPEAGAISAFFNEKEGELLAELSRLQKRMRLLQEVTKKQAEEQTVAYHAVQKTIPSRLVLSLRKKVAGFDQEKALWNELYETLSVHQLSPVHDGYTLAIYHDQEHQDGEVDIEIQQTIAAAKTVAGPCQVIKTTAVPVISATFAGGYQQMPQVNQALAFWLEHEKAQLAGPMLNIFHVSPAQTNNVSEYVTEACYMIKPREEE